MSKKKAYVIGTNVSTSLSPEIFNYWFKKYKIILIGNAVWSDLAKGLPFWDAVLPVNV